MKNDTEIKNTDNPLNALIPDLIDMLNYHVENGDRESIVQGLATNIYKEYVEVGI